MKRKPLLLAIALLLIVGAALWGVNYRLDHPPLTGADKEFRALVAGADSVEASQYSCQRRACATNYAIRFDPLNVTQTRHIIEELRFVSKIPTTTMDSSQATMLKLEFRKGDKAVVRCTLWQSPNLNEMSTMQHASYRLNPRANKRLNRVLDAYLPQRIRP